MHGSGSELSFEMGVGVVVWFQDRGRDLELGLGSGLGIWIGVGIWDERRGWVSRLGWGLRFGMGVEVRVGIRSWDMSWDGGWGWDRDRDRAHETGSQDRGWVSELGLSFGTGQCRDSEQGRGRVSGPRSGWGFEMEVGVRFWDLGRVGFRDWGRIGFRG
ncbi:hypothetical protein TIFTF001_008562 [Ficus carica]|uniref:Uncharacterized protein n=1 Tax=Ficus carica TaxID=3494 RepID=A0AA88A8T4_FICCA|nr:hypothetical protein TIFTF001_008562 [Ficus carica]